MKQQILAFGIAREIVGDPSIELEPEITSVGQLRQALANKYPALGEQITFMIAVNNDYASDDLKINENDEIAIIPPVSGG